MHKNGCRVQGVDPSRRFGIVRSTLHIGYQSGGDRCLAFDELRRHSFSVRICRRDSELYSHPEPSTENLAHVPAVHAYQHNEGRRHGRRAHPARQPNEKPVDAQRCRDIIESNLRNGTRRARRRNEEENEEEERNGDTWSGKRPFILSRRVSRILKSSLGLGASRDTYRSLDQSFVGSAAGKAHITSWVIISSRTIHKTRR